MSTMRAIFQTSLTTLLISCSLFSQPAIATNASEASELATACDSLLKEMEVDSETNPKLLQFLRMLQRRTQMLEGSAARFSSQGLQAPEILDSRAQLFQSAISNVHSIYTDPAAQGISLRDRTGAGSGQIIDCLKRLKLQKKKTKEQLVAASLLLAVDIINSEDSDLKSELLENINAILNETNRAYVEDNVKIPVALRLKAQELSKEIFGNRNFNAFSLGAIRFACVLNGTI